MPHVGSGRAARRSRCRSTPSSTEEQIRYVAADRPGVRGLVRPTAGASRLPADRPARTAYPALRRARRSRITDTHRREPPAPGRVPSRHDRRRSARPCASCCAGWTRCAGSPDAPTAPRRARSRTTPRRCCATLGELVEELERSHRRLIETNVQLVSLREVASSMVSTLDAGETTRTVTRYLCARVRLRRGVPAAASTARRGRLEGTWTQRRRRPRAQRGARAARCSATHGALARALWLNRTRRAPRAAPPPGRRCCPTATRSQETLARPRARWCACRCSAATRCCRAAEPHELCGARCIAGRRRACWRRRPAPAAETLGRRPRGAPAPLPALRAACRCSA